MNLLLRSGGKELPGRENYSPRERPCCCSVESRTSAFSQLIIVLELRLQCIFTLMESWRRAAAAELSLWMTSSRRDVPMLGKPEMGLGMILPTCSSPCVYSYTGPDALTCNLHSGRPWGRSSITKTLNAPAVGKLRPGGLLWSPFIRPVQFKEIILLVSQSLFFMTLYFVFLNHILYVCIRFFMSVYLLTVGPGTSTGS